MVFVGSGPLSFDTDSVVPDPQPCCKGRNMFYTYCMTQFSSHELTNTITFSEDIYTFSFHLFAQLIQK